MSAQDTSGAPSSAPVATAGTPPPMAATGASQPFGTFGSTRGSGLARGKRVTPTAAPASAPSGPGGYQPSALEVIRPPSEYKNPFTGETSVASPVVNDPAPQAAPLPAPVAFQPSAPAPIAKPPVAASTPAPAGELFPFNATTNTDRAPAPAEKPELKILPPAESKRPATSWESGPTEADDRRNERPTFRPERREGRPFEPREGRSAEGRESKPFAPREQKPFEPREPRRDHRQGDARSNSGPNARSGGNQHQHHDASRAPHSPAEAPKSSGGFFGWLKSLLGGKPAESAPTARTDGQRRRHRGGRGRGGFQGDNRGPRNGQPFQHPDPRDEPASSDQGGERGYAGGGGGGDGQGEYRQGGGGGGRRRRRGGRGRFRGEGGGGDRGNDPSPEGQQGGGAI